MISYLSVLPVVILSVYSFVQYLSSKAERLWWTGVVVFPILIGLWYLLRHFWSMEAASLSLLMIIELLSFELLQVRHHKMSLLFHSIFYLTAAVTAVTAVAFPESTISMEFILLLIYFLTESNQNYLKKTYEESTAEYQNQILTKQVNEVQNIYMTMRGWRHDYHNHLQTLKALLKLGQLQETKAYLDSLEGDLDSIHQLIETGNVNLDAILNSKLSLALKDEIDINYKAEVPTVLTVSDIDLCVLIGNLIDNAVEACNKLTDQEGNRFLRLYIGVLKKQLYISVTNGTNELARKLDVDYITTKRGNHGHGLKRINKIVEKYGGYINRKNEPGVFVTEIMLPL